MTNIGIFTHTTSFFHGGSSLVALPGTLQTATNPSFEQSSGMWLNSRYVKLQTNICIHVITLFSLPISIVTHRYFLIPACVCQFYQSCFLKCILVCIIYAVINFSLALVEYINSCILTLKSAGYMNNIGKAESQVHSGLKRPPRSLNPNFV